jgi:hypothetical protein
MNNRPQPDNCEHCGHIYAIDPDSLARPPLYADHWCRCTDCGAELPNNDYDDLCKRCNDVVWQTEARAGIEEWQWHNDR